MAQRQNTIICLSLTTGPFTGPMIVFYHTACKSRENKAVAVPRARRNATSWCCLSRIRGKNRRLCIPDSMSLRYSISCVFNSPDRLLQCPVPTLKHILIRGIFWCWRSMMSSSGTRLAQCLACFLRRTSSVSPASSDADCSKARAESDHWGRVLRWILSETCTGPLTSPPVPIRWGWDVLGSSRTKWFLSMPFGIASSDYAFRSLNLNGPQTPSESHGSLLITVNITGTRKRRCDQIREVVTVVRCSSLVARVCRCRGFRSAWYVCSATTTVCTKRWPLSLLSSLLLS